MMKQYLITAVLSIATLAIYDKFVKPKLGL
jgi:hypothetical protein